MCLVVGVLLYSADLHAQLGEGTEEEGGAQVPEIPLMLAPALLAAMACVGVFARRRGRGEAHRE